VHTAAVILALVAFALQGAPVRTPSAEEQRLFDEGAKALADGNASAAQKAWQAGFAISRDPAFLVHIGEAQEKAGQPAEAVETYRRYLQLAPDASDRAEIEARLTRLGATAAPAAPPAPAGDEAPGEFGAAPPRAVPPPPAPGVQDREHPARGSNARQGEDEVIEWSGYKIAASFATAAAVTLVATAGLFAASAASDADDINRLLTYRDRTGAPAPYSPTVADQYEKAVADGERHDRYAKIALVGAAGAAAVAATLFLLDSKLGNEPRAALVPTGNGFAAAGVWRF
jgi:hypothetical protein